MTYSAYIPKQRSGFRLDPRSKILFMAFITTLMFFKFNDILFTTVLASVPFILLFLNKQKKLAFIYGGLFALAIIAVNIRNTYELPQVLNAISVLLIALVLRLFPTLMMGYYVIASTKVNEFITAMKKWHISEKFIIPVSVVFRFIPTIREESRFIKDAMYMREIKFGTKRFFKNPFLILEYRLIPMIISVVKIGEELSASALTRGLGQSNKRTNIAVIKFCIYDYIILFISLILLIWAII